MNTLGNVSGIQYAHRQPAESPIRSPSTKETDHAWQVKQIMELILGVKKPRDLKSVSSYINKNGKALLNAHLNASRYVWDSHTKMRNEGWVQFDTEEDSQYFGIWVNPDKLMTFTYAEGDLTLIMCSDATTYNTEIAHATQQYKPSHYMSVIDDDGLLTKYSQNRNTLKRAIE